MFNIEVDDTKDFVTPEDEGLGRVDRLAAHLRQHPLLPLDPRSPGDAYTDIDSGVRLPLLHCGFKDCTWTRDVSGPDDGLLLHWGPEWTLFTHLVDKHGDEFREEFELCGIEAEKHTLRSVLVGMLDPETRRHTVSEHGDGQHLRGIE